MLICSGKITYYTHPPETHTMPTHISAEFVSSMSKEFDVDALLQEEHDTLKGDFIYITPLVIRYAQGMVVSNDPHSF